MPGTARAGPARETRRDRIPPGSSETRADFVPVNPEGLWLDAGPHGGGILEHSASGSGTGPRQVDWTTVATNATDVSFSRMDITDLSPLAGRPIRILSLYDTKVTDLTPLAGMPLVELQLARTVVADLTALKGMPLRRLNLQPVSPGGP